MGVIINGKNPDSFQLAASEAVTHMAHTGVAKKSLTAAEGRVEAPKLEKVVAKYPDSPQKAKMETLLDKLATSGWNEADSKQYHDLNKSAPKPGNHSHLTMG